MNLDKITMHFVVFVGILIMAYTVFILPMSDTFSLVGLVLMATVVTLVISSNKNKAGAYHSEVFLFGTFWSMAIISRVMYPMLAGAFLGWFAYNMQNGQSVLFPLLALSLY